MTILKINGQPLWHSTQRITTPSIVISKSGEIKYIPLFVGQDQEEIQQSNYYYKLGKLKVSKAEKQYRACESARYQTTISDTLSTTIKHSGKTGTTTTYPSQTKSGNLSGYETVPSGGAYINKSVSFGVTFTTITSKTNNLSINSAQNGGTVTIYVNGGSGSGTSSQRYSDNWSVTGTVKTTTTTYPSETKSNTASKQVNYGITFPNAPTILTVNNGCTVTNNSNNSSCTVSKTLSGTVAYNKSATLTQNFSVTAGSSL